jgi:hypothetical protein
MTLFSPSVLGYHPERQGNPSLMAMKTALTRWCSLWTFIRAQISPEEWASLGFYRNGYNFWLVTQLLFSKKKGIDVAMGMKVNCEDKLKQLKVLLQEDGD